jgi:hypothetical protein
MNLRLSSLFEDRIDSSLLHISEYEPDSISDLAISNDAFSIDDGDEEEEKKFKKK